MMASVASTLEDELESESDEALLVEMDALTELRDASTLDEDREKLLELALIVARVASTLEDDDERLSDEV
jgi:hypothetical protein